MGKIWKIMKHLSRHVAAPKNTCRVLSADHSRASFLNSSLVAGSWNQKDVMTVDVLDRSVPLDWRKVFSIERDRVAKSSKDVVSLLNCAAYHPCSKCQFLAVPSDHFLIMMAEISEFQNPEAIRSSPEAEEIAELPVPKVVWGTWNSYPLLRR